MPATAPGGQVEYRKLLGRYYIFSCNDNQLKNCLLIAMSFFQKFVVKICEELSRSIPSLKPPQEVLSCIEEIHRPVSKGEQVFTETEGPMVVGKSMTHVSALKQVTGEALYVDDIPHMHDELYAVIVGSAHAHANIL